MQLFDDPRMDGHDPGDGHPERKERLPAIRAALANHGWRRRPGRLATTEELLRVHLQRHIDRVMAAEDQTVQLDPDTRTSPGSIRAALVAAGASLEAALRLAEGESSFVLCRPPGHHATADRAMGFCIFNNAALAADQLARSGHRVLVFDPDVHHGNGTQDIFYSRGDVLYVSLHRYPFYPGTGGVYEQGNGEGEGATLNITLPEGSGDGHYMAAMEQVVLPAVDAWRPDACVISAGYDALAADPLGGMKLSVPALCALWGALVERMPCMAVLEGGYDLAALADGVRQTAEVLAGGPAPRLDVMEAPLPWLEVLARWRHPLLA